MDVVGQMYMYLIAHIIYNAVSVNKMLGLILLLILHYSFTVHSMIFRPVLSDIFSTLGGARGRLCTEKNRLISFAA